MYQNNEVKVNKNKNLKMKTKKIKCYMCGKEINEDEAIPYDIPSCCGLDEIKICKECHEKLIKEGIY